MSGRLAYQRLRAPQKDGAIWVQPSISELASAKLQPSAEQSTGQSAEQQCANCHIGGRSLEELQTAARRHLVEAALKHTQSYTARSESLETLCRQPIYLVGHQPELFHPGVWLKNFVLDRLARHDEATAIHLLIDNDAVTSAEIEIPSGPFRQPRIVRAAFDRASSSVPWEERRLLDCELFGSFAHRVSKAIAPFVDDPLVNTLWKSVDTSLAGDQRLGLALAQLRHRLELAWGLNTWEVPLSAVCKSETFHWFVATLLDQLPQLHASYNGLLAEYRRLHRLRSLSRPVPDLQRNGEKLETPLWIWTATDPRRRRLLATIESGSLRLSDGENWSHTIPKGKGDVSATTQALAELAADGIKIRPRALMTTLYARLFLSERFIHGIGGAKYDAVTDRLSEDLFGLAPPPFWTVTGTRYLPVHRLSESDGSLEEIGRGLRELKFHPEKHLDETLSHEQRVQARALVAKKRQLLHVEVADRKNAKWHQAIGHLNQELQDYVCNTRNQLELRRGKVRQSEAIAKVLKRRDFAFCLFSEATLRQWLLDAGNIAP